MTVWLEAAGDVTVDMGAPQISAAATATVDGQVFEGVAVSMGNPHLVCVTDVDVASLDLTTMPDVDGLAFPDGVNVEFVNIVGERHAQMRVYERGSGETQSCGSGACAVVAAMAALDGDRERRIHRRRAGRPALPSLRRRRSSVVARPRSPGRRRNVSC